MKKLTRWPPGTVTAMVKLEQKQTLKGEELRQKELELAEKEKKNQKWSELLRAKEATIEARYSELYQRRCRVQIEYEALKIREERLKQDRFRLLLNGFLLVAIVFIWLAAVIFWR